MFKAALREDPRNVSALVNLGCLMYQEDQRYDDAAIKFLDALAIKPDDEDALCNLALALKQTGDNNKEYADLAFREAIEINPNNTFIIENYLFFLLEVKKMNQFKEVLGQLKFALEEDDVARIKKVAESY